MTYEHALERGDDALGAPGWQIALGRGARPVTQCMTSYEVSVLVGKLEAAHGACAMVVQPLPDAGIAEAVRAGQMQQLGSALEVIHANVALLVYVRTPRCTLKHRGMFRCDFGKRQQAAEDSSGHGAASNNKGPPEMGIGRPHTTASCTTSGSASSQPFMRGL